MSCQVIVMQPYEDALGSQRLAIARKENARRRRTDALGSEGGGVPTKAVARRREAVAIRPKGVSIGSKRWIMRSQNGPIRVEVRARTFAVPAIGCEVVARRLTVHTPRPKVARPRARAARPRSGRTQPVRRTARRARKFVPGAPRLSRSASMETLPGPRPPKESRADVRVVLESGRHLPKRFTTEAQRTQRTARTVWVCC